MYVLIYIYIYKHISYINGIIYIWLVVKILVNGKDYPIYYGKLKMFETTNQI